MKKLRTLLIVPIVILLLNAIVLADSKTPWLSFINEDLFGLTSAEKDVWKLDQTGSVPILTATADTIPTLIRTTTQFGQFDVSLEYALSKGGKASLLLKTDSDSKQCVEIPLEATDSMDNLVEFKISNNQINDKAQFGRGFIGIKLYNGTIRLANWKLKPESANMKSLFNGKDVSGWKKYDTIDVGVNEDGEMTVKNGNGSIETADSYGDFELVLDAFVNGDGLNSGVFFRCIPGEKMNGYECQIHFGFLDGDRGKPKDCGTGGIFRRTNARKVIGNDKEWVNIYINAVGNHFAVWVNGEQVTDWIDTRKDNPNPRRGLRLDRGTIQLQGHDATSNFKFRDIAVGVIPER